MKLAIAFTNFGPYHLARLRALGSRLEGEGGRLVAHEMAAVERKYPWMVAAEEEPFERRTLFPDRAIEDVPATACASAMTEALDADRPDAVAIVGYSRPESRAALRWAERHGRPAVLLSETQRIDAPRTWWKEAIKRRLVRRFWSALVGGETHRAYLMSLGMPRERIALGYNAVDHEGFARRSAEIARDGTTADRPYFLSVSRFAPEKNLIRLLHAFALYRRDAEPGRAWDLVLCGDGALAAEIDALTMHLGIRPFVHRPGFLGGDALVALYARAGGFVLASRIEPWGLVANEAAACRVPLLISERCGCVETLVPSVGEATGRRFDPTDIEAIASAMAWLASLPADERSDLGEAARRVASRWGPSRFADGMMEAIALSEGGPAGRSSAAWTAGASR